MPSKSFMSAYSSPLEAGEDGTVRSTKRIKMDSVGAFALGAADTLTFGFLDEAGAAVDSFVFGRDYDEVLAENRAILRQADEEHGTATVLGGIAGGFVPFLGWGGRTVKGATIAGGAYGAAYGFGSGETWEDRFKKAGAFGALGLGGGYLISGIAEPLVKEAGRGLLTRIQRGKAPVLDATKLPKRPAADPLDNPLTAPKSAQAQSLDPDLSLGVKPATNPVMDELEDGALLTVRDLLGDPGAAAKAVAKRLGRVTPQQAEKLLNDIQAAEASGEVFDNPHFRSLLKVDLSDEKVTTEQVVRAAEVFEDAVEKLAEKAGQGARTVKGMDQEVANEMRKGVTLADLETAFQKSQTGFVDARIAQHTMVSAAAKVVRLREELLPRLIAGEEGIRDKLAEELTDAAHRMVFAKGILSNAGRTLGILSHGVKAKLTNVADDAYGLTAKEVGERVKAAIGKLSDDDVKDLLGRIRTLDDAENLERILLDEVEAETYSAWRRTVGSVSLFLRSNALTPATFAFNSISMVLNSAFRGQAANRRAVRNLERAGRVDEATMLRLENQAVRSVYWRAHREGLKALVKRIQWETWSAVENISAVGWGRGAVNAKARLKKDTMLADGFSAPSMREFDDKPRLNIADTVAFNARNEARRASGGAFANIVYHLEKARAVAANTLDAAGGASMKLFTAAPDDWGREFVRIKEAYAQATRFAFKEAKDVGLPDDKVAAYVEARARELAEMPTSEMMRKVDAELVANGELSGEAEFLIDLQKQIENEADKTLFMDGPQSAGGKASANFLSWIDRLGLVLPYVRTPIRILENGLLNYGPFHKLSREVQDTIAKGGIEAEIEKARIEVGMNVFNFGIVAGLAGAITATNGGFENSAGLDAGPPSRFNFPGGGFIEIGRLDPFALTVSMGAMIGQAYREGWKTGSEYDVDQAVGAGMWTAFMAARESILDKSYLKGLNDIVDLGTTDPDQFAASVEKLLSNAAARFVPMGGIGRQFNDTFRTSAIEAVGWQDNILRTIPGMGWGMAPKVDPLGDEVKSRNLGINFGSSELTEGGPISPVKRKLRELGIDITTIRKADPEGFNLSSEELSEVRRIRGKEALNSAGMTMQEALGELFEDPWFESLPSKDQKREAVVEVMREFNKPAWELLFERNAGFASKKTYTKSLADYMAEGLRERDADALAREEVELMGLPQPDL